MSVNVEQRDFRHTKRRIVGIDSVIALKDGAVQSVIIKNLGAMVVKIGVILVEHGKIASVVNAAGP